MKKTTALIDIDGVLIDNIAFERKVTEYLIQKLAEKRNLEANVAREYWDKELSETKNDIKWYDYDFHCANLGLPRIAKEAHQSALSYVKVVKGSLNTWGYLKSRGIYKIVVTDTREWIAKMKLRAVNLNDYENLYSSAERSSKKDMEMFWCAIEDELPTQTEAILIDNKISNIEVALKTIKNLKAIYFRFDEHVSTLSSSYKPKYRECRTKDLHFPTVRTHDELIEALESLLGE